MSFVSSKFLTSLSCFSKRLYVIGVTLSFCAELNRKNIPRNTIAHTIKFDRLMLSPSSFFLVCNKLALNVPRNMLFQELRLFHNVCRKTYRLDQLTTRKTWREIVRVQHRYLSQAFLVWGLVCVCYYLLKPLSSSSGGKISVITI